MIFSDLALARRLERAEGRANADFVEARAVTFADRGATWIEVGGALAMFDGVESPLTQTFGLGMHGPVSAEDLDRIERFFAVRHSPVFHEVSPLADGSLLPLLNERQYQVVEFTSVMWRPIGLTGNAGAAETSVLNPAEPGTSVSVKPGPSDAAAAGPGAAVEGESDAVEGASDAAVPRRSGDVGDSADRGVTARRIREDEHDVWARTGAAGWSHLPELTHFLHELAIVNARRRHHVPFLVEVDGRAIAAGGLAMSDGVALLAGASTVPEARRRGAQRALLEARLRYAAEHGCDIAMMGASPGSESQRNAERQGFRIAYTRVKWRRMLGSTTSG